MRRNCIPEINEEPGSADKAVCVARKEAYCTSEDIARMAERLQCGVSISSVDSSVIDAAIAAADAEVDFALRSTGRTVLENPAPQVARSLSRDLALSRLCTDLCCDGKGAELVHRAAYRARTILDMFAAGRFSVPGGVGAAVVELVTGDQSAHRNILKNA